MTTTAIDQEIARLTTMVEAGNRTTITMWWPEDDRELRAKWSAPHHCWQVQVHRPKRDSAKDFGAPDTVRTEEWVQPYDDQLVKQLTRRLRRGWLLGG